MAEADRFQVLKLGAAGAYHVICRHGFREAPKPDDAFVQIMVRRICESVRYQAMTARWGCKSQSGLLNAALGVLCNDNGMTRQWHDLTADMLVRLVTSSTAAFS